MNLDANRGTDRILGFGDCVVVGESMFEALGETLDI
jgi:hypothetical protein